MKLKKTLAGAAVAFSLALTAWLPGGTVNPTAAVGMYIHDIYEFYGFVPIPYTPPVCAPRPSIAGPGLPFPSPYPPCLWF